MSNFLDPEEMEPELDLGIFEEEEEDVVLDQEIAEEKDIAAIKPHLIVDVEGAKVDATTGEVLEEADTVPTIDSLVEDTREEVEEILDRMDKLEFDGPKGGNNTPGRAPKDVKEDNTPREVEGQEDPFSELSKADDKACPIGPKGKKGPVGVVNKPAKQNSIQKAIDLMDYRHVKELEPQVSFKDCNFGQFEIEITEAQEIIDRYYQDGYEINAPRAEWDLAKLSAIMVRIGRAVGYFQGAGGEIEKFRRAAEAGCYVELKELKDEHGLSVSDKDAEKASRMLAAKYTRDQAKGEILSKMITNFWFAARKFIDILDGIIIRNRSESKLDDKMDYGATRKDPDAKPKIDIWANTSDGPPDVKTSVTNNPLGIEDEGCGF